MKLINYLNLNWRITLMSRGIRSLKGFCTFVVR